MGVSDIVLLIILVTYLTLTSYFLYRIIKTPIFTKKQKIINGFLIVILPFIWCVLIYYMTKPDPEYDPELKRKPPEHFYETNTSSGQKYLGNY